jgi:hypothetical protein
VWQDISSVSRASPPSFRVLAEAPAAVGQVHERARSRALVHVPRCWVLTQEPSRRRKLGLGVDWNVTCPHEPGGESGEACKGDASKGRIEALRFWVKIVSLELQSCKMGTNGVLT